MIRRLLSGTIVASILLAAIPFVASAATVFRDNFSDGDAEDGMPVTWIDNFGTLGIESGSLVIEGDPKSLTRNTFPGAADVILLDASVRVQFRLLRGERIGVFHATLGSIFDDGRASLGGEEVQTAFDPKSEDLIMQVDYTSGALAEMWIWRSGESMPSEPLLATPYTNRAPTSVHLFAEPAASSLLTSKAVFRYVHVADSHVPEPSSLLLSLLGLSAAAVPRHRSAD